MNRQTPDTTAADREQRGEQTGKRTSEERNDPEVQPGAREGQPDGHALRERKDRHHRDESRARQADPPSA